MVRLARLALGLALVAVAVYLVLSPVVVAGCAKSTCKRAAERMAECHVLVGHLGTDPNNLTMHQGVAQLEGACDVAVQSDPAVEQQMHCVVDAPTCDAIAACGR